MLRRSTVTTTLGTLAIMATLALASPGVRVARSAADASAGGDAEAGATCEAGATTFDLGIPDSLHELQRQFRARAGKPRSDAEAGVLDDRGYDGSRPPLRLPKK